MLKLTELTGQAALKKACANLELTRRQYRERGVSTAGWCQRFVRMACEGRRESDYHWLTSKGAGLRVPQSISALEAAAVMRGRHDELGWKQIHGLQNMPAGAYALVYLSGSHGFGHVLIARWTGKARVCMVNDNNGVYPMTHEQMTRIMSAWLPI